VLGRRRFLVLLPAVLCATACGASPSTARTGAGNAFRASDAPATGDAPRRRLVAYASGYAPDLAVFSVDPQSGALAPASRVRSFGAAPSFLAVNPAATNLYAVDEADAGAVGAYAIDRASGALTFLGAVSSGGAGPAFVSVDATGRFVLVANYDGGSVAVLPVGAGGLLGNAVDVRAAGAGAHMTVLDPSNRFLFVPCRDADHVAQFVFDASTGKLTPNAVPRVATGADAGPRHLAFHPNGRFAYLINEDSSTMTAYAFDSAAGTLAEIERKSTLPAGFSASKNTGAEVWVHPSGAWLFGSNRGHDSIVVFAIDAATGRMTLKGFTRTGGVEPRDFTLDPSGTFLYAANQTSGTIVPFRFDPATGTLAPAAPAASIPKVSFVGIVRL
jgi:6-phosphogluconolactonase